MKYYRTSFIFIVCAIAVFTVACGGDVERDVTLYPDENWQADLIFTIPIEALALVGSVEEIEAELEGEIVELKERGVDASWSSSRQDTLIIYTIEMKGIGYGLLNEVVFDRDATIMLLEGEQEGQIYFLYPMSRDPFSAGKNTLKLNVGEVVSSNGEAVDRGTLQWVNAGRAEAVATPKSRTNLGLILLLAVIVGGAGGGYWFYRQQQSPAVVTTTTPCGQCQAPLSPQAQFCPNCGAKRT
jgi:hypothetical protein